MVRSPHRYYRSFAIQKKNGHIRVITAPRVFMKTVQRYILDCILSQRVPHGAACGFRRGFNCGTGAKRHVSKAFLWNIDLKDFFPSITKAQVKKVFEAAGYPEPAAFFLSGLCCLAGSLPQGAPTSPALANLVAFSLDENLQSLADAASITYTRYADDMSFSSSMPITREFRQMVDVAISEHGFSVNPAKTRLMGPATRREVTGLYVNEGVSIPRWRRRQLRAMFHQVALRPAELSQDKSRVLGYARWLFDYHSAEGRKALSVAHQIPTPNDA
jgi:retron-type reverse transcriptase